MRRWLYATSHKEIGTLYILLGGLSGLVAGSYSGVIRSELSRPGSMLGDDQTYNVVVTAHALVAIIILVMPVLIGGIGNWLIYGK